VSDGTAHDASPDDGDVHMVILSGWSGCLVRRV
jgi:hypothetical protein